MFLLFLLATAVLANCPDGTVPDGDGCKGKLSTVLASSLDNQCSDLDAHVWINGALTTATIYELASQDWVMSGKLTANEIQANTHITTPTLTANTHITTPTLTANTHITTPTLTANTHITTPTLTANTKVTTPEVNTGILTASNYVNAPQITGTTFSANNLYVSGNIEGVNQLTTNQLTADEIKVNMGIETPHMDVSQDLIVSNLIHAANIQTNYIETGFIENAGVSVFNGNVQMNSNAEVVGRLDVRYWAAFHDDADFHDHMYMQREEIFLRGYGGCFLLWAKGYLEFTDLSYCGSTFSDEGKVQTYTFLRPTEQSLGRDDVWGGPEYKISIWASGSIASDRYIAASDRRIKKDIEPVPDNLALSIIRKLDAKYYHYIDTLKRGPNRTIGFIAQEVLETIPEAVQVVENFIPNEMNIRNVTWEQGPGKNWTFALKNPVEKGTYRFYLRQDNKEQLEELTTADGTHFMVTKKHDVVFLYGKKVKDFLTIDKDKIFSVAYAALQQIDTNQQALTKKIQQATNHVDSMKKAYDDKIKAFEKTVDALERLIQAQNTLIASYDIRLKTLESKK